MEAYYDYSYYLTVYNIIFESLTLISLFYNYNSTQATAKSSETPSLSRIMITLVKYNNDFNLLRIIHVRDQPRNDNDLRVLRVQRLSNSCRYESQVKHTNNFTIILAVLLHYKRFQTRSCTTLSFEETFVFQHEVHDPKDSLPVGGRSYGSRRHHHPLF